jgi:SAM-dependent methyltransferase
MLREIAHFLRQGPQAMRLQTNRSRAEFVDVITAHANERGYGEVRRSLVGGLRGRVLEIGCGTGSMFDYYDPAATVVAIEPEADFFELAVKRAAKFGKRIEVADGNGMALAFERDSFDAVVLGLVLCSVPSVEGVLREAYRVLRPSGLLRAFEHVRSKDRLAGGLDGRVQSSVAPAEQPGMQLEPGPARGDGAGRLRGRRGLPVQDVRHDAPRVPDDPGRGSQAGARGLSRSPRARRQSGVLAPGLIRRRSWANGGAGEWPGA